MSNNIQEGCKHSIINKYYCVECGTLYNEGVSKIIFIKVILIN